MASGPDIPDPNKAAIQGIQQDAQNYPFEYLINALSQMGGSGTIDGKTFDFTGLGTADVQGQLSDQMAQTLLDIQNGLGPAYVKQRLADLQQSDPTGYAARQQLFDKILTDANTAAPDAKLSADTQQAVMSELQRGAKLDPRELEQVQQGVRGKQIASGVYLGNAAEQQEAGAVVQAGDQARAQREGQASAFLSSGVSPSDIEYRKIQQDMANIGAFLSNTTPTAQFGSLAGAQSQAAPYPNTGYQAATPNPNAAQQGVNNAMGIYSGEVNWNNNQVNPYMAGLSTAGGMAQTAFSLGYSPWSTGAYATSPGVAGVNYGQDFSSGALAYTPEAAPASQPWGG